MIKKNTVFLNGRKIGTYEFVQKAGSGHINFNGFDPYEAKLTDDQQVVLDYLKNIYSDVYEDCTPLETMYLFGGRRAWSEESNLTDKEELQVLAAFAEWGMSQEDNQ